MNRLRFTLISDGSSDKALIPILHWLLSQYYPDLPLDGEWADLARLPKPPKGLAQKIASGSCLYPCDLLFIHRDAEREPHGARVTEIQHAVETAQEMLEEKSLLLPRHVCVIPVHMLEAWLLFDINGIRRSAGNPNGKISIQLPPLNRLESLPDPKNTLYQLLRSACELHGRKLKKYRPQISVHRLTECIDDFSPLRELAAFQFLENEIRNLGDIYE